MKKEGGDLEQIATEYFSTEMHSNHNELSAKPKRPPLSIVELFLSALEVLQNFQQKRENMSYMRTALVCILSTIT